MSTPVPVSAILERIAIAGRNFGDSEIGSRETLIELGRDLVAALEIPSEFLQRTFWAEPALSAHCKFAVQVKLFQNLGDGSKAGLSPTDLADRTGVDVILLQRIMRHLISMKIVTFSEGKFFGTTLSHSLAADNYQKSIDFCYDVARPSFNGFPEFSRRPVTSSQPTPPHLDEFDKFMSAYRAGKANWYDQGFYPVSERLIKGFDASIGEVLLVDVGGGRGHDAGLFATQYSTRPGKLILQDPAFHSQAHDFFTPQPIQGARAYSLHSILHDWDDEEGIKILENLVPALKPGYSRVLLNEIVLSEQHPTIAATSMDMMMLAHFAVRERTEADWKAMLEKAGLMLVKTYSYPRVAESVIEAELSTAQTRKGIAQ
ncbi:putative hydroxyindole O-methyltransferase [Plenodomus tracheiphilus IPT5]|uniref:Putative hydroxyindole O-methyltransferase n=1 Tax=Plenodomus tracheiphilus IPT5 TaxID=1408161 RepID=A0A6A7BB37_9PLEO|nr:putative hydroxyindole O-methyltransferase [Plenodomus tracheiphilus IPT5]